jgi:hypothetical protein
MLCDRLTDGKAFEIEEALIRRFGNAFANAANSCLDEHLPLAVLEARWSRARERRSLREELQRIAGAYPAGESRIEQLRKFIKENREEEQPEEERERSDAMEFAHISLLHRMRVMRLHIKEPRMKAVLADAVS